METKIRSPGRLRARRRLVHLPDRDRRNVGVIGNGNAIETISVFANKDMSCSQCERLESKLPRCVGQCFHGLAADATARYDRINHAVAVRADDPPIEPVDLAAQGYVTNVVCLSRLSGDREEVATVLAHGLD